MRGLRCRDVIAPLILVLFALSVAPLGQDLIRVGWSQEGEGTINLLIRGYDNVTPMYVSLLDSSHTYIENRTVNSSTFSFGNVNLGKTYFISLRYKDVGYLEKVQVNEPSNNVTIIVYDTTESDEDIVVDIHHIILNYEQGVINVKEALHYGNRGTKAFNGKEIKVSMPEGYQEFTSEHRCCMTATEYGFAFQVPEPIKPNSMQYLEFTYSISPSSNPYEYTKKNFFESSYTLACVTVSLRVTDFSNLEKGEDMQNGEMRYATFTQPFATRDSEFALSITGFAKPSLQWLWVGVGLTVLFIGGSVVYSLKGGSDVPDKLLAEKKAVNRVLQELEKDFTEGKIREIQYLKLKLKFKKKLEKLEKRLRGSSLDEREPK